MCFVLNRYCREFDRVNTLLRHKRLGNPLDVAGIAADEDNLKAFVMAYVGVKRGLDNIHVLVLNLGKDLHKTAVLVIVDHGDDSLTFPMISCGAVGVISVIGNALPKEFSKMIRLEKKGEFEGALKIHHRFTDLFSLLFVDGNPAGVKAMLHQMGFIDNVLRLPLVPTRLTTLQRISEILKELKI